MELFTTTLHSSSVDNSLSAQRKRRLKVCMAKWMERTLWRQDNVICEGSNNSRRKRKRQIQCGGGGQPRRRTATRVLILKILRVIGNTYSGKLSLFMGHTNPHTASLVTQTTLFNLLNKLYRDTMTQKHVLLFIFFWNAPKRNRNRWTINRTIILCSDCLLLLFYSIHNSQIFIKIYGFLLNFNGIWFVLINNTS